MLLQATFFGVLSTALTFATCEIGQRLQSTFTEIEDTVYQLQWYLYPIQIQRMLIPITIYTQQTVVIQFFGSIACSREQFKKVSHLSIK